MRYYRRLPPFSREIWIVGLLLTVASLVLSTVLVFQIRPFYPLVSADATRMQLISMNLGMLGFACLVGTIGSTFRLRQWDRLPLPVVSWQSQMRTIMLLAALPLCTLTWALFVPPSLRVYGLAFGIDMLEGWVVLIALFVLIVKRLPAR